MRKAEWMLWYVQWELLVHTDNAESRMYLESCHSLNHFTPSKPLNIDNSVTVS